MNGWLVVVIVLLCCCCIALGGGYYLYTNGDQLFNTGAPTTLLLRQLLA